MKPNNVIYLKCTSDSFFRAWVEILTPWHQLSPRMKDVAARILMQYFRLKEGGVSDKEVLNELLWSKRSRQDMMDSLGMAKENFQMELTKLRKTQFLVNGEEINPRYIPHRNIDDARFMLQVVYDWSSKDKPIRNAEQD